MSELGELFTVYNKTICEIRRVLEMHSKSLRVLKVTIESMDNRLAELEGAPPRKEEKV